MKKPRLLLLAAIELIILSAFGIFPSSPARGQFAPGQTLSANALNAALARPVIVGGSIDGAPVGSTVAATGRFTTLTATTFSLIGPIFGTNLLAGPDTGRFALDGLRLRNNVTNDNSYLTLMPNGTGTESALRLYNKDDPTGANLGAVNFRLTGTSAFIEPVVFGTGATPTSLGIAMNTTITGTATATSSVVAPLVGTTTAAPLQLQANGTIRWNVDNATGTFYPQTDNTLDFGGTGSRIARVFTPIVDSGTTGALSLKTNNGQTGLQVANNGAGTTVNNLAIQGSLTGQSIIISAVGADTNIPLLITSKGSGAINFFTEGAGTNQFQVLDTVSATRNITITGSNGGNPTESTTAGSLNLTAAGSEVIISKHLTTLGTAPTMGACGTSPSVVGNDNAMLITVGAGGTATSCAVTFATAFTTNPPVCIAQNNTDRVAYSMVTTTTTATITAAAAFTASSKFHVHCIGWL